MDVQKLGFSFLASVYLLGGSAGSGAIAQSITEDQLMRAPEEGGARRWEVAQNDLSFRIEPSTTGETIKALEKGAVVSNFGCTILEAENWCEVREIRGGPRGFVLAEGLTPAKGPDGVIPLGVDDSKNRVRKRDFDEKSELPCAQEQGQSLGKCQIAVARSSGGDATLLATFPNGFARMLFFVHGEFVRASATMSGVGTDIDWQLVGDIYSIRVDDQRFEVPRSLVVSTN